MKAILSSGEPKVTSSLVRSTARAGRLANSSSMISVLSASYATTEPSEWPTQTTPSYSSLA